jgi:hypothetical protein
VTERHSVELRLRVKPEFSNHCLEHLEAALPDAEIGEPDAHGLFEIELEAPSRGAALSDVWSAIVAAGADDDVVFALHPNLPDHWLQDGDTT